MTNNNPEPYAPMPHVNEHMVVEGTLTTLDDITDMYSLTGHMLGYDPEPSYKASMLIRYGFATIDRPNGIAFGVPTMTITDKGSAAINTLVGE